MKFELVNVFSNILTNWDSSTVSRGLFSSCNNTFYHNWLVCANNLFDRYRWGLPSFCHGRLRVRDHFNSLSHRWGLHSFWKGRLRVRNHFNSRVVRVLFYNGSIFAIADSLNCGHSLLLHDGHSLLLIDGHTYLRHYGYTLLLHNGHTKLRHHWHGLLHYVHRLFI